MIAGAAAQDRDVAEAVDVDEPGGADGSAEEKRDDRRAQPPASA
jgi:hypothetical protein